MSDEGEKQIEKASIESLNGFSETIQKEILALELAKIEVNRSLKENEAQLNHKSHLFGTGLGSLLALSAFILTAFAISQKASLLELATVFAPIAALAGVFLWGFQRKD